jgi:hypothetical protein
MAGEAGPPCLPGLGKALGWNNAVLLRKYFLQPTCIERHRGRKYICFIFCYIKCYERKSKFNQINIL